MLMPVDLTSLQTGLLAVAAKAFNLICSEEAEEGVMLVNQNAQQHRRTKITSGNKK